MPSEAKTLRVLAVDDSAVMREVLRTIFRSQTGAEPLMELCGVVCDGFECLDAVERLRPDAIVLDLEMPRMDGLGVLAQLRLQAPEIPVVLCSASTERGAKSTLEALALGAKDYVMKPSLRGSVAQAIETLKQQLLPKLAALVETQSHVWTATRAGSPVSDTEDDTAARVEVVVIGVSTGGPSALELMLPMLPRNFPVPVLVVQHMPRLFTGALAERLNRLCRIPVRQAADGAAVVPGTIWLAPGDVHLEVLPGRSSAAANTLYLHARPALNSCRPSVDYLFQSAAKTYGAGTLALVMTGMGSDGLNGSRAVKRAGGRVLAQDQSSSAVWGMPGRVAEAGLAEAILPLHELSAALIGRAQRKRAAHAVAPAMRRTEVQHGLL